MFSVTNYLRSVTSKQNVVFSYTISHMCFNTIFQFIVLISFS